MARASQVSIYPSTEQRDRFKAMADAEKRTEAQMIVILADEAADHRDHKALAFESPSARKKAGAK